MASSQSHILLVLVFTLSGCFLDARANVSVSVCSPQSNQLYSFVPGKGLVTNQSKTVELFLDIVQDTKERLYKALTKEELLQIEKLRICIDTYNQERWGFYYLPKSNLNTSPQITLGLQSLKALANLIAATSISESLEIPKPYRWWSSYALYLRRSQDWSQIVNPMNVFHSNAPDFEQRIAFQSTEYFRLVVAFILAHEISHVLLGHDTTIHKNLSREQFLQLVRNMEEKADRLAIQLLTRPVAFFEGLGPSGAGIVFVNWHIIDGEFGNERATHPADTKRMKALSNFILNEMDHSLWPTNVWKIMRNSSESFRANAFAAEQPGYFEAFDKTANNIQLMDLRFDRFH